MQSLIITLQLKSVILLSYIFICHCYPSLLHGSKRAVSTDMAKVVDYLHEFGYLSDHEKVESQLRSSLRNFQKHIGIKATGNLDTPTLKNMRLFRCGNADMMENDNHEMTDVPPAPWPKKPLTYRIDNVSVSLSNFGTIRKDIKMAFDFWAKEAELLITEVLDPETKVDINISFETGPHHDNHTFLPDGITLAHAFYPNFDENLNGDIHFNDFILWSSGINQRRDIIDYDFLKVATHEIGHALGLSHSETKDSIMFPTVSAHYDVNFMLHAEDKENIKKLYGPRTFDNNDLNASPSEILPNYETMMRLGIPFQQLRATQRIQNVQNTEEYYLLLLCSQHLNRWPFQCFGDHGTYCCRRYLGQYYFR